MVQSSLHGCKKSNGGNVLAIMNLYDLDQELTDELALKAANEVKK